MKGTKTKGHGSLGKMPKRMGNKEHGSFGNLSKPGPFQEKHTSHAAGRPAGTTEGGKKGAVKMPKTRPASFGK